MLKFALFDPRRRRRPAAAPEAQPGAHDDFKPTQPAVLSLELPSLGRALPLGAPAPGAEAAVPQPGARMTLAR